MSPKLFFALLLVGVVVVEESSAIADLTTFLNLVTSLKYNQPCSWTNEEARQNLTRDMSGITNRFGSSSSLVAALERFSADVVTKRKHFCSAPELLICDKDSERCVCGDPGKEVSFDLNEYNLVFSSTANKLNNIFLLSLRSCCLPLDQAATMLLSVTRME